MCFIACGSNCSVSEKQTCSKVLNVHKLFLSNRGTIGCNSCLLLAVIFRCRIGCADDEAVAKLCGSICALNQCECLPWEKIKFPLCCRGPAIGPLCQQGPFKFLKSRKYSESLLKCIYHAFMESSSELLCQPSSQWPRCNCCFLNHQRCSFLRLYGHGDQYSPDIHLPLSIHEEPWDHFCVTSNKLYTKEDCTISSIQPFIMQSGSKETQRCFISAC